MTYSKTFRDGLIELTSGDAYAGPDNCFAQVCVNTSAYFIRKNGSRWKRVDMKNGVKIKNLIESCESADHVMSVLPFTERG